MKQIVFYAGTESICSCFFLLRAISFLVVVIINLDFYIFQVKPKNFTYSMISKMAVGPGNDLERMFKVGATQEAVQLIVVISNVLNDQANDSDIFKTSKRQVTTEQTSFITIKVISIIS